MIDKIQFFIISNSSSIVKNFFYVSIGGGFVFALSQYPSLFLKSEWIQDKDKKIKVVEDPQFEIGIKGLDKKRHRIDPSTYKKKRIRTIYTDDFKYIGFYNIKDKITAIIRVAESGDEKSVDVGDAFFGNTITKITKDRVEMKSSDGLYKYIIKLNKAIKQEKQNNNQQTTIKQNGFKKVNTPPKREYTQPKFKRKNKYSFSKDDLEEAIFSAREIMKSFKYKIVRTPFGVFPQVTYIEPDSLLSKIGIEVGDSVMSINGKSIMDNAAMFSLFSNARNIKKYKTKIFNNGEIRVVEYEIE